MREIKILGVKFHNPNHQELMAKITEFLNMEQSQQIVTVNPEFLLEARSNDNFHKLLNEADLTLADGFGIKLMAWLKGRNITRHTGADLTIELLQIAQERHFKIGIINWSRGLSSVKDIDSTLKLRWPGLEFKIINIDKGDWSPDLTAIKVFGAEILFCALGAPFQDQLLYKILPSSNAKIGVGVGGSFDYLTGKAKRAPRLLRGLGLEWLWRLAINPRVRLKRIFNAVIKFPLIFISDEFIKPWLYRPNVVSFIYRDDEVLIVNSAKEKYNFWKLPQGGRNFLETSESAVLREMYEELHMNHFRVHATFLDLYKYRWPKGYSIRGYKGQRQSLFIMEYLGDGSEIKLDWENRDYKWVKIANLLNEVHPVLKEAYTLFLKKFRETVI